MPANGADEEDGVGGGGGGGIQSNHPNAHNWGRYDSSALHIQHALRATEVQRKYSKPHEKPLEEFLVSILMSDGGAPCLLGTLFILVCVTQMTISYDKLYKSNQCCS